MIQNVILSTHRVWIEVRVIVRVATNGDTFNRFEKSSWLT